MYAPARGEYVIAENGEDCEGLRRQFKCKKMTPSLDVSNVAAEKNGVCADCMSAKRFSAGGQ